MQAEIFKPALIVAGGSAYPRDWDYAKYREIADANGSLLMMDMAHISGLVATQEQVRHHIPRRPRPPRRPSSVVVRSRSRASSDWWRSNACSRGLAKQCRLRETTSDRRARRCTLHAAHEPHRSVHPARFRPPHPRPPPPRLRPTPSRSATL